MLSEPSSDLDLTLGSFSLTAASDPDDDAAGQAPYLVLGKSYGYGAGSIKPDNCASRFQHVAGYGLRSHARTVAVIRSLRSMAS
ncbi:hypothetical protein QFZ68_000014 [Streptomyces sp. V1I6]|nr:hypothetical protein [Streptomyces sp. V1I6]